MHIPDGMLDVKTVAATGLVGAGGLGYALHRLRAALAGRTAPLMGVTAACVFAAQMLNFPVAAGTSGHLIGGVLSAVLLGPWAGLVVLTVVLVIQCLLFQDGGLLVLGANIVNIGVIGSLVGYCLYAPLRRWIGGSAGVAAGSVVAAWFSVLLASIACSLELAASGTYPLAPTLSAMVGVHVLIGVGEALITGLAVAFILRTRPDLIHTGEPERGIVNATQVVVGGLAIALVFAVLLSPWASELPDGLEWAVEQVREAVPSLKAGPVVEAEPIFSFAPLPDYQFPGVEAVWTATSIAGLVGTLTVFVIAFVIGRSLGVAPPVKPAAHVA
jgi:cobalt/nickel transport system permease protein